MMTAKENLCIAAWNYITALQSTVAEDTGEWRRLRNKVLECSATYVIAVQQNLCHYNRIQPETLVTSTGDKHRA